MYELLAQSNSSTNFTFKISGSGLTLKEILTINNYQNFADRINAIYNKGNFLEPLIVEDKIFRNKLILIDSLMPQIIANALIISGKDGLVKLSEICTKLTFDNPLGYDQSLNHKFYEHKLKRFLSEVALGMMPNKIWTGLYDNTEGYIIVKEDGDVICYHIINRNLFEDYLLENTRLETPSTTRHGFGSIFSLNNELFFKLNLQIRFL